MSSPGTDLKGGISLPMIVTQRTDLTRDSFDSNFSSMIYPTEGVLRVPESALDPALVRCSPVPAIAKSVYPDNATG